MRTSSSGEKTAGASVAAAAAGAEGAVLDFPTQTKAPIPTTQAIKRAICAPRNLRAGTFTNPGTSAGTGEGEERAGWIFPFVLWSSATTNSASIAGGDW